MSSRDMRMNIHINGDNKGFRKSLKETERELKQFESGMSAVGGIAPAFAGTLGGIMSASGIPKYRAAFQNRKRLGAELAEWKENRERNKRNFRHLMDSGRPHEAGALWKHETAQTERMYKKSVEHKAMVADARGTMARFLAGAGVAAAVTALAAITIKKLGNQNRLDQNAKEFSGAVMAHEAEIEVRQLRRNIARSKSPAYVQGQIRAAEAAYAFDNAGTSTSGVNAMTELKTIAMTVGAFFVNNPDALFLPAYMNRKTVEAATGTGGVL